MNKTHRLIAAAVLAVLGSTTNAAEPARQAATAELPAALAALEGGQIEVLTEHQAAEVRGQWWIHVPLHKQGGGEIFIRGTSKPFVLTVHTVSAKNLYRPVRLQFKIGH